MHSAVATLTSERGLTGWPTPDLPSRKPGARRAAPESPETCQQGVFRAQGVGEASAFIETGGWGPGDVMEMRQGEGHAKNRLWGNNLGSPRGL